MVRDNEIKATVSPFAIRPGEIKVFDGKDGYVSMNQIIQKINVGHINDLHFRIMEIVNEYEFITSRQLFKLLEKEKFELKSQDKLNNKLSLFFMKTLIFSLIFEKFSKYSISSEFLLSQFKSLLKIITLSLNFFINKNKPVN